MNKKFLQSVAAGIATLSLVASCSHLGLNKESNTCGAKNGCAAKKDEAHKCAGKHHHNKEAHKCAAAKEEKAKEVKAEEGKTKKAKKTKKAETKAEEKKN